MGETAKGQTKNSMSTFPMYFFPQKASKEDIQPGSPYCSPVQTMPLHPISVSKKLQYSSVLRVLAEYTESRSQVEGTSGTTQRWRPILRVNINFIKIF